MHAGGPEQPSGVGFSGRLSVLPPPPGGQREQQGRPAARPPRGPARHRRAGRTLYTSWCSGGGPSARGRCSPGREEHPHDPGEHGHSQGSGCGQYALPGILRYRGPPCDTRMGGAEYGVVTTSLRRLNLPGARWHVGCVHVTGRPLACLRVCVRARTRVRAFVPPAPPRLAPAGCLFAGGLQRRPLRSL